MISIIHTQPGDSLFHLMKAVSQRVYGSMNDPLHPNESFNEDFFVQGFVALRDGQPVARAALYHNPFLKYEGVNAWCTGNYEADDDPEAGITLLAHVAAFAKLHGAAWLLGPMNGSTWDTYRFRTDDHEPLFFLEPRHPVYYNHHFLAASFSVIAGYHSSLATSFPEPDSSQLERELAFKNMGVSFRTIDLTHYEDELARIHAFNGTSFSGNFLYTPISLEAFIRKYANASAVLHPELTMIAEDRHSNIIGYYFCYDDLLNRHQKCLVFKTLVRHPAPEWRGLGHVMGHVIGRKALLLGYEVFIHPFIYDQGTSVTLSADFEGTHYKRYALYGKQIS